jgi:hypothetical protein
MDEPGPRILFFVKVAKKKQKHPVYLKPALKNREFRLKPFEEVRGY